MNSNFFPQNGQNNALNSISRPQLGQYLSDDDLRLLLLNHGSIRPITKNMLPIKKPMIIN